MLRFLERDQPGHAAIFFPGGAPPPAEAFARLRDTGYQITERQTDDVLWALRLEHPDLGTADLWCDRAAPPLAEFIKFANNLTDAEMAAARESTASVQIQVPAKRRNILRDRKTLLRVARDVMGDDGVMVLDTASQLPWSRDALADELSHDADLDVEALYCLHAVFGDDVDKPGWLHTHGLAELGVFDVDVVAPHPEFAAQCGEMLRAISSMVLLGEVADDQDRFVFGKPGGEARFVPAGRFMRDADPTFTAFRDAGDHAERRSVLCEPAGRKVLGFGRGDRPDPLRFARRSPPEQFVIYVPTSMTELMGERAKATLGVLRAMAAEFAEFEVVTIAKLGYPTRDGGKEHLWFEVHGFGDDTLDATLANRPFAVDLREGERAERPIDLLTDWILMTPAGNVTPRSLSAARKLREHADEIRASMAEAGAAGRG